MDGYLRFGVVFPRGAVAIVPPCMPRCIIPPFFIIALCIAAMPSLMNSVTSAACCCSADLATCGSFDSVVVRMPSGRSLRTDR
jgi:hypothetical protein